MQDVTEGRCQSGEPIHMNIHTNQGQKSPSFRNQSHPGVDITQIQPLLVQ